MITIISLTDIDVDGTKFTSIVDAVANTKDPVGRAAIHEAATAYDTALVAAKTDAEAKAGKVADFIMKVKDAVNAGDFESAKAILNPEIEKVEQTEKERKLEELSKQLNDIQSQIDALNELAALKIL